MSTRTLPQDFARIILASRHVQALHWIERAYPEVSARLIYDPNVKRASIDHRTAIIGSWPIHLVAGAGAFYVIEFERKPNRAELTADEMIEHGAYLRRIHAMDDDKLRRLLQLAQANPEHSMESLLETINAPSTTCS